MNCFLKHDSRIFCLLKPGADGDAGQLDGEEQDCPHHTGPAGKKKMISSIVDSWLVSSVVL